MKKGGHTNMENIKLGEVAEIISGQIMTRIKVDNPEDKVVETRKVIIPKAITEDGFIKTDVLPEEGLKTNIDEKRITKEKDIVIKLNAPFDSATIGEDAEGCVVPSFCAIIRLNEDKRIMHEYVQAFLNSELCKEQLETKVQGSVMTLLTVGKLKDIVIPVPDEAKQHSIGMTYIETQDKLRLLNEIIELEKQKNSALFYELGE